MSHDEGFTIMFGRRVTNTYEFVGAETRRGLHTSCTHYIRVYDLLSGVALALCVIYVDIILRRNLFFCTLCENIRCVSRYLFVSFLVIVFEEIPTTNFILQVVTKNIRLLVLNPNPLEKSLNFILHLFITKTGSVFLRKRHRRKNASALYCIFENFSQERRR